jgi:seryl-tRNA synthetase
MRSNLKETAKRLKTRGFELNAARFDELEGQRKAIQMRTQELQAKRNSASKLIGQAKAKGEDASAIMAEVSAMN